MKRITPIVLALSLAGWPGIAEEVATTQPSEPPLLWLTAEKSVDSWDLLFTKPVMLGNQDPSPRMELMTYKTPDKGENVILQRLAFRSPDGIEIRVMIPYGNTSNRILIDNELKTAFVGVQTDNATFACFLIDLNNGKMYEVGVDKLYMSMNQEEEDVSKGVSRYGLIHVSKKGHEVSVRAVRRYHEKGSLKKKEAWVEGSISLQIPQKIKFNEVVYSPVKTPNPWKPFNIRRNDQFQLEPIRSSVNDLESNN